ncbi:hypothetical protein FDECE_4811 [Fusarium decemcellulare]|nr:hypothetical protein FDECE_4811 [Fusarium decemcellulare]
MPGSVTSRLQVTHRGRPTAAAMSGVVLDADQPAIPAEAVRGASISLDALPALAELTHIARSSGAVGVGVASERAGCVAEAEDGGGGEKDRLDLHFGD